MSSEPAPVTRVISETRTRRSLRNAGVSVLGQGVVLLLGLVTRTVFLHYLGIELLGVQSLLFALLAIASVADAGANWALMYALYRPLQEGDDDRTAAVVQQAARWYRWIAAGTALIGLSILPFLDILVQSDEPVEGLHFYYAVLLAGAVMQYPMYHRVLLLEADQKSYVTKLVTIATNVAKSLLQITVLVLWQDFLLFLALQAGVAVVVNTVVYRHVGRRYEFLTRRTELSPSDKRALGVSVRATLVYRISGLAMTNTAPILISAMLGAATLGYYSNYMLLVGAVLLPLDVAFGALVPSVGNLVAGGDGQASRRVLDELQLISIAIYGISAAFMFLTLNDIVSVWLGDSFVLTQWVVVAVVANFYVVGTQQVVSNYRSATGMFRDVKYVMALTATLNLGLASAFGLAFGLTGILFAALIARLLTNVWIEPMLLFRRYLPGGLWHYVRAQLLGAAAVSTVCLVALFSFDRWVPSGWATIIGGGVVALLAVPAMVALAFGQTSAWRSTARRAMHILGRS